MPNKTTIKGPITFGKNMTTVDKNKLKSALNFSDDTVKTESSDVED